MGQFTKKNMINSGYYKNTWPGILLRNKQFIYENGMGQFTKKIMINSGYYENTWLGIEK